MRTLLFALCTLALVGCKEMGIRPAGPLAKHLPSPPQGQPPKLKNAEVAPDVVAAARPPAIKPTPPTLLVTPGEVNADNAHAVAQQFAAELSADSKATTNVPVTAEISRVGRVKP